MRHGQPNVAAHDLAVAQGPLFTDTDAVERARDRIRKPILLVSALDKELRRQLLKPIGGPGRRTAALRAFRRGKLGGTLKHHAGGKNGDLLKPAFAVRPDRGSEGGSGDPFIFGQQSVSELMKVRAAAD